MEGMINMTFKGLKEELSRTLALERIQLASYLNAPFPFAGNSYITKKKKNAAPAVFPEWEEKDSMDGEPEVLIQQVFPSAGRMPEKPRQPEAPRMQEGRAVLRQAVVFSEIIGEPVCRKRKRKAYGNQSNIGRR